MDPTQAALDAAKYLNEQSELGLAQRMKLAAEAGKLNEQLRALGDHTRMQLHSSPAIDMLTQS